MEPMVFIMAVAAAAVYGVEAYLKNVGEDVDYYKLSATIMLGLIVGAGLSIVNMPITRESVAAMFLTYTGLLVLIENGIKAIVRRIKPPEVM